jgi:hypothetical protein
MAMEGKGKDSLETRLDLEAMNVRSELHPIIQPDGKKKLPVASWTLDNNKKGRFVVSSMNLKCQLANHQTLEGLRT